MRRGRTWVYADKKQDTIKEGDIETAYDLEGYSGKLWYSSRNRAFEEVLEIIDDRITLINNVVPGKDLGQELRIVKEAVLDLKGDK